MAAGIMNLQFAEEINKLWFYEYCSLVKWRRTDHRHVFRSSDITHIRIDVTLNDYKGVKKLFLAMKYSVFNVYF